MEFITDLVSNLKFRFVWRNAGTETPAVFQSGGVEKTLWGEESSHVSYNFKVEASTVDIHSILVLNVLSPEGKIVTSFVFSATGDQPDVAFPSSRKDLMRPEHGSESGMRLDPWSL